MLVRNEAFGIYDAGEFGLVYPTLLVPYAPTHRNLSRFHPVPYPPTLICSNDHPPGGAHGTYSTPVAMMGAIAALFSVDSEK